MPRSWPIDAVMMALAPWKKELVAVALVAWKTKAISWRVEVKQAGRAPKDGVLLLGLLGCVVTVASASCRLGSAVMVVASGDGEG
jgi:hypothetical protein